MKWDIKKSNTLKERIAENEELMGKLSSITDEVLRKHGIELEGLSYVFEPRVFQIEPGEMTEVAMKSRAAMISAISEDLVVESSGALLDRSIIDFTHSACLPYCGPLDPITLAKLERIRIPEIAAHYSVSKRSTPDPIPPFRLRGTQDPIPPRQTNIFINEMMRRKDLLSDLSESIFRILKEDGIEFSKNEGCVFIPVLFETPIFAQKVAVSKQLPQANGFGPKVYGTPTSLSTKETEIRTFPGIIEYGKVQTVGVIVDRWWWVGIPAPEILKTLDIIRKVNTREL